jgi:hypothetical protein
MERDAAAIVVVVKDRVDHVEDETEHNSRFLLSPVPSCESNYLETTMVIGSSPWLICTLGEMQKVTAGDLAN